jgi:hypothetical protein
MLGSARPTVSLTAAALRAEGLLDYTRGVVTILDRGGLEAKACSCYEQIRRQYSLLVQLRAALAAMPAPAVADCVRG